MVRKTIAVFGDSHARLFQWIQDRGLCPEIIFRVLSVPGATAYGSTSLRSRSGFLLAAEEFIQSVGLVDLALIMLGEVDCSIAANETARERSVLVGGQIRDAVERLVDFGYRIASAGLCGVPVVFLCPMLPCVKDKDLEKGIQKRRSAGLSLEERTANCRTFEELLRIKVSDRGGKVESINDVLCDPKTQMIKTGFLQTNGNHHLRHRNIYGYWLAKLEKYTEEATA